MIKNGYSNKFIYSSDGEIAALQKIHEWFAEMDMKKMSITNIDLNEEISVGNENFFYGFSFTPIILINGRQLPDMYDRKDIFYFIDDLIET